jgi:hypothetical protein
VNQANYFAGVYAVTQSLDFQAVGQNYLTNVGAYFNSPSAYGTFDQTGNVGEFNDLTGSSFPARGIRGGWWSSFIAEQSALYRYQDDVRIEHGSTTGFRLAAPAPVPEPATWVTGACGLGCAAWEYWRRRRAAA